MDWWLRGGQVAVVVNWRWRTVERSRVLAVEWRSSGGGGGGGEGDGGGGDGNGGGLAVVARAVEWR